MSFAYQPIISPLALPDCDDLETLIPSFVTKYESKVDYEMAVPGMVLGNTLPHYKPPPGLTALKGASVVGGQREASPLGASDEQEEVPVDNSLPGLLRRYWYLVLPLVISSFISADPPPAEGGGEGGGGTAAAAGAVAAGAAAGGAAAGGTRARGKRTKRG